MVKLYFVPKIILATVLGIVGLGQTTENADANSVTPENGLSVQALPQNDWSFWPSEREPAPRRTSSGSTRNPTCVGDGLRALTPHEQIGVTSQARPDILLYVPATMPRKAIFAIESEDDFYHAVPINLPETAGIVSLPLPEEVPALAPGKQHRWSLLFLCHEDIRPDSPVLSGWLETRTTLDETTPQIIPSLAQAARYRDDLLWYDMIAMLAQLKMGNPDDTAIHQAWHSVLERHELNALSDEPIFR